jgi:hypothetical protein
MRGGGAQVISDSRLREANNNSVHSEASVWMLCTLQALEARRASRESQPEQPVQTVTQSLFALTPHS